jgi:hypothetical protein
MPPPSQARDGTHRSVILAFERRRGNAGRSGTMHGGGREQIQDGIGWAAMAGDASLPRLLLLGLLAWAFVSVVLVGGLGAWIATMRAWRERRPH